MQNRINNFLLKSPIQLFIQGQWLSLPNTQHWQSEQWCASFGLSTKQVLHLVISKSYLFFDEIFSFFGLIFELNILLSKLFIISILLLSLGLETVLGLSSRSECSFSSSEEFSSLGIKLNFS